MPQSGAAAETWLVGTQTLDWKAGGPLAVLAGHVLGTLVEPAAPSPSNPSNENMIRHIIFLFFEGTLEKRHRPTVTILYSFKKRKKINSLLSCYNGTHTGIHHMTN